MRGSSRITSGSFYVSSKIPAPKQKQTISPQVSEGSSPKSFISYDGPNTPPGEPQEDPFHYSERPVHNRCPVLLPQTLARIQEEGVRSRVTTANGSISEALRHNPSFSQFDRVPEIPFPPPFVQVAQQVQGPQANYRPPFSPRRNHHRLHHATSPSSPLGSPLCSPIPSPPKQFYSPFNPPQFFPPNGSPLYAENAFYMRDVSPRNHINNVYNVNNRQHSHDVYNLNTMRKNINFGSNISIIESPP